jgi:hypothetical protein
MGRKGNRPNSPRQDVRTMDSREKVRLLGAEALAKAQRIRDALLAEPRPSLPQARKLLASEWPFVDAPPREGRGDRPDPALERAARQYIAAIETKDAMRAQGFGGFIPDNEGDSSTLGRIAEQHFPHYRSLDPSGEGRAAIRESIRDAAKNRRRQRS